MRKENIIIHETTDIIRINLKSGNIKTCVFLINNEDKYTLIDSGLDEHNILDQLLPALQHLNIPIDKISQILLTHSHDDHIGGLHSLLDVIPDLEIYAHKNIMQHTYALKDGRIGNSLQAVYLPGHTADSFGFLDLRTNSLISGDALQFWGIEKYGTNAELPVKYLCSHDKLLSLPIENIFSSHAYDFCGIRSIGAAESKTYISESKKNYEELVSFTRKWSKEGKSAEEICLLFENEHLNYPKMQKYAIDRIIQTFYC